jgi:hypothetical protein
MIIRNIIRDGVVVYSNVKEATIRIVDICNPVFITATITTTLDSTETTLSGVVSRDLDIVSRGTSFDNTNGSDFCCGIRSVKLSLQEDGAIVGTVTGLPGDVYNAMRFVMSGVVNPIASIDKYTITSWREDGPLITLSAISTVTDAYEKISTSAIFKTIPQDIYDLHISGIIPRSIQNPLDAPDSTIYIRSSDIYGTDGWTVQDILDTLNIDAVVPSSFNYHVYQLTVTRGAPIISLLHNLLPIPGLLIERNYSATAGSASYYITIAKGYGYFYGTECKIVGSSQKEILYSPTIIGQLGEPLYIDAPNPSGIDTANLKCTFNLIKGIFNIDESTVYSHTDTKA